MSAPLNLCVVLDQSGSMYPIQSSTRETLRELIKTQASARGETNLTLLAFNEQVTCLIDKEPLTSSTGSSPANPASPASPAAGATVITLSRPTGGTALYDAVGNAINRFDQKESVFMAVITDGLDNESTTYTPAQIAEMVRARPQWGFAFYAANQDSKVVGAQLGFVDTQDFQFSSHGIRSVSESASRSCDSYRASRSQPPPSYPATPMYQVLTPPVQPPEYSPAHPPAHPHPPAPDRESQGDGA